jgi:hypothetical protein
MQKQTQVQSNKPGQARPAPQQTDGHTRKAGNSAVGTDDQPAGGPRFHLLEKALRPITLLEMASAGGKDEDGVLKIIETEEQQLQAIHDLYLIVKAQPKYKKLKEPNWKPGTRPLEIITWLLRKLGPLAAGKDWTVDTYQVGKKTRYRFVIYEGFHGQLIKCQNEHIALDFLPGLQHRDLPLHDLIIDVVALISKRNKIPLWDNDGDYSAVIDQLKVNAGGSKTAQIMRHLYTKGDAAQCLLLLKRRRRMVTIDSVAKKLSLYKAKSERQSNIIAWLRNGIDLARTGWNIGLNTFVPNYIQGGTVNPRRLYKFVWGCYQGNQITQSDLVTQGAIERMQADIGKNGYFLPVRFSVALPGQRVKESVLHKVYKNSYYNTEFAVMLFRFLSNVRAHFKNRYKDYYYKSARANKKPASPYLINNINLEQETNILLTI